MRSDPEVRGAPAPDQRLPERAVDMWRAGGWAGTAALLVVSAPAAGFLVVAGRTWLAVVVAVVAAGIGVALVAVIPRARWARWRYAIREDELDLQRGVLTVTRTLVPMARVQRVDTEQDVFGRRYGLKDLTVHTAAGMVGIPALDEREADRVRDHIIHLAKLVDDDD